MSLEQQQEFYNQRWSLDDYRPNRLLLERYTKVLDYLHKTGIDFSRERVKICDLGCGRGWIANQLSCFGEVVGVELSNEAVETAQQRWPHIQFVQGDLLKFRSEEKFDIVISSEVIEHVSRKSLFIETIDAILRPGGHLILTTPNGAVWPHYQASGVSLQPIEEWLSMSQMKKLLKPHFKIIRHECITPDHSCYGILRLISSPKLINVCNLLKLEGVRKSIHSGLRLGLHQTIYARYKG